MSIGAVRSPSPNICMNVNGGVNRCKNPDGSQSTLIIPFIVKPNAIPPNQYVFGILDISSLIPLIKRLQKFNIGSSPYGYILNED